MGEFFKGDKTKEIASPKKSMIAEPQILFATYNGLVNKIDVVTDEGYNTILPIRAELMGDDRGEDIGQLADIRRRMRETRMERMTLGTKMMKAIDNVDGLTRWSDRYIKYLEEFIDELKYIAQCSFLIINNQTKLVEDSKNQMEVMKDSMIGRTTQVEVEEEVEVQRKHPPVWKKRQYHTSMGIDSKEFEAFVKKKIDDYKRIKTEKPNDAVSIGLAKGRVLAVGGKDDEKRELLFERIEEANKELEEEKKEKLGKKQNPKMEDNGQEDILDK